MILLGPLGRQFGGTCARYGMSRLGERVEDLGRRVEELGRRYLGRRWNSRSSYSLPPRLSTMPRNQSSCFTAWVRQGGRSRRALRRET